MKTSAPLRRLSLLALPVALLGAAAAAPAAFSHKLHVGEQEVPCKSCHDLKPEGLPTLKTKGCGKCHEDGPPAYKGPTALKLKVAFPHSKHSAKLECATCHKDVLEDRHDGKLPLVAPKQCASCHAEKDVALPAAACARCHGTDIRLTRPADHDGSWTKRHGVESGWRVYDQHGKTCTDCHRTSTCRSCHNQQAPADHNGLWRARTHGLGAEWDRDRCKACHETGTCIRCHQSTPPMNHTGAWRQTHALVAGSTSNDTCNACHQAGWCAACHAGR
jgi:c(7)-type cytochrome triheme protein